MDLSLSVTDREIKPQVVNIFQYENDTTTLTFTLDSYVVGEVDLRNYKCYVVTSQNGLVDMTELETIVVDSKLIVTWDIQEYSTRQAGAILYQLAFKENANDGENTGVFYSYKGILLNRLSIDADNHITANYPTILKQWLDRINTNRDELIDEIHTIVEQVPFTVVSTPYGETIDVSVRTAGHLYWFWDDEEQTKGHFEDHQGIKLADNTEKLECSIADKEFEINALYEFHNKDFTHLMVDTFEDTSGITGDLSEHIEYDEELHMFIKPDETECELTFYTFDTTPYSTIWALVDWEDVSNGAVEIVLVTGETETVLTNNEEITIVGNADSYIKLNLSGQLKLKNLAWGLK